jgi:ubiquinone/menaquinone biosynthesis C-methylase UbiE
MSRVPDASDTAYDHAGTPVDVGVASGGESSTDLVATLHGRIAPFYDALSAPVELLGGRARRHRTIRGATGDVLEVGVGTGLNLHLYPPTVRLTAIDVSGCMLERARARAARLHRSVHFWLGNVERLPFESESFDTVIGTYVFCSVEHPVAGMQEVWRVLRPGGQLRLLEAVRPRLAKFAAAADTLSLLSRRLFGSSLNREIEADLALAGFEILRVRGTGIWREIVARPEQGSSPDDAMIAIPDSSGPRPE